MSGLARRWFDDFVTYWHDILGGRPIPTVSDFNALLHEYRKRQQHVGELSWSDAAQHVANWQEPEGIYQTLHNARKLALHPIAGFRVWRRVPRGARVLEYGCSLAPYYYCYRLYFSHLECSHVLADIPNFPFHYAKYLYRHDAEVEFATIDPEKFREPLAGLAGEERFDVIIVTTVFEHLDDPPFVSPLPPGQTEAEGAVGLRLHQVGGPRPGPSQRSADAAGHAVDHFRGDRGRPR